MLVEATLLEQCAEIMCVDLGLRHIAPVVSGPIKAETFDFELEDAIDHDIAMMVRRFSRTDPSRYCEVLDHMRNDFRCQAFRDLTHEHIREYFVF